MFKSEEQRKGQGLLEAVIAIGVIVTGLISVISLVISNLSNQRDTATRYQAMNLAREAVELVRNMRDTNWLAGQEAWKGITIGDDLALVFSPANRGSVPGLDPVAGSEIKKCADGILAQSFITCTENTPFLRTVSIQALNCLDILAANICSEINTENPVALKVTAKVMWNDSGKDKKIELVETIYNWR